MGATASRDVGRRPFFIPHWTNDSPMWNKGGVPSVWVLQPGAVIRIAKTFKDGANQEFTEGTILHFTNRNFVPYHDGHTLHFREGLMHLCTIDDTGIVVQNVNDEYFAVIGHELVLPEPEPVPPVTAPNASRGIQGNRGWLIGLQAFGALSILAWPAVLIANVMSIAGQGHTFASSLPWVLLSFYPLVWIGLYVFAWRAMARGQVRLAFGLSAIPALFCLIFVGIYAVTWIRFLLAPRHFV